MLRRTAHVRVADIIASGAWTCFTRIASWGWVVTQRGKRMAVFAKALKAETALDELLRERGHELGIEEGSRLERVVRTPNVRELTRELNYELGLGRGMGLRR